MSDAHPGRAGATHARTLAEAARRGVSVVALSSLRTVPSHENALLLGFALFNATDMRPAMAHNATRKRCTADPRLATIEVKPQRGEDAHDEYANDESKRD